jgi:hypothetical protein
MVSPTSTTINLSYDAILIDNTTWKRHHGGGENSSAAVVVSLDWRLSRQGR